MKKVNKSMKGKARHVTPAKYYGRGDVIEKLTSESRTVKGNWRKTVRDYCDNCNCIIKVRTRDLQLRPKGYKLLCFKCFKTMENKHAKVIYRPTAR